MSWTGEAPALATLEDPARQRLESLRPTEAPRGAVLFRPGEAVKGYVIVLAGSVAVNLVGPGGRDILLYRVQPGQACIQSTLGLMSGEDYSGEAITETDSRVVLIPRALFLDLVDTSPAFRTLVFAAFAERMQSMMHVLERIAFQKVESRLAAYLLERAGPDGTLAATQADIATAIGTAREVISRRLDALERRGAIRRARGTVHLGNPELLRALAEDVTL